MSTVIEKLKEVSRRLFGPGAPWGHPDPATASEAQEVPRGERGPITDGPAASSTPCVDRAGRHRHFPASRLWPTQVPPLAVPEPGLPGYSLQPALSRPSRHHIGHKHGSTGPVTTTRDGDAKAPAGVLRGDQRQSELLLPSGTKVLPLRPHCHSHQHPLREREASPCRR